MTSKIIDINPDKRFREQALKDVVEYISKLTPEEIQGMVILTDMESGCNITGFNVNLEMLVTMRKWSEMMEDEFVTLAGIEDAE